MLLWKGGSLHGELVSVADNDLVCHDDFLGTAPPVLVTPDVAPAQKVSNWHHRDAEAANKRLSSDHWEEQECASRCDEAVLEPSQLVLLNPKFLVLQVIFCGRCNGGLVLNEMD